MNKDTRNRYSRVFAPLGASLLLLLTACGGGSHSSTTSAAASTEAYTTTISSTQKLSTLTIASNETLVAPSGYSLSMTVNGVEMPLAAGTYTGEVVLAVTAEHAVSYHGATEDFRMGLYVEDGGVVVDKSVTSALVGVTYGTTSATGGTITSMSDKFNGIVIGGTTGNAAGNASGLSYGYSYGSDGYSSDAYAISGITLNLVGNGGNDFAGWGAALMTTDTANVMADNLSITTDGCIRPAVFVGGNSTLRVKNSKIVGKGVTAAEAALVSVPMMNAVPWLLGISGNCRATNVLDDAQATYQNCSIEAEAWGALSTDSTTGSDARLTAEDCVIKVDTSGYGSYADGTIQNTYSHCTFTVPDYILIVAAGSCGATFQSNNEGPTTGTSDRFGIMWHKNADGTVALNPGTTFTTGETMFLVKSTPGNLAYPNLVVDHASLTTNNGVLFHLMESDDPGMGGGAPGSATMWASSYTVPTVVQAVQAGFDTTSATDAYTVHTTYQNMNTSFGNALVGDIYNTRWKAGTGVCLDSTTGSDLASSASPLGQNLSVVLQNTEITGVISAGKQSNKYVEEGGTITPDTRQYLGEESVVACQVFNNGVILSLDATSIWTVTGTSFLSKLIIADGAQILAPTGKTVKMKVGTSASDLVITEIKAGTYSGFVMLYVE